ncbi:hypothetical protein CsSME_00013193 [Camellia sinensis var. sinensis]
MLCLADVLFYVALAHIGKSPLEEAATYIPGGPHFITTMSYGHGTSHYPKVYIPVKFLKESDLSENGSLTLRDPSGKPWPVKLHFIYMTKGWYEFYTSNKLKDGDVCLFELNRTVTRGRPVMMDSNPSYTWRSIFKARPLSVEGLRWQIGDGRSVQVWGDRWLNRPSAFKSGVFCVCSAFHLQMSLNETQEQPCRVLMEDVCEVCEDVPETVTHCLQDCKAAKQCWEENPLHSFLQRGSAQEFDVAVFNEINQFYLCT